MFQAKRGFSGSVFGTWSGSKRSNARRTATNVVSLREFRRCKYISLQRRSRDISQQSRRLPRFWKNVRASSKVSMDLGSRRCTGLIHVAMTSGATLVGSCLSRSSFSLGGNGRPLRSLRLCRSQNSTLRSESTLEPAAARSKERTYFVS